MTAIESDRRRDGWHDWISVVLADGQEWSLPGPKVEYLPVFVDGRPAYRDVPGRLTHGLDYEAAIRARDAATGPMERVQEQAYAVAGLLTRQYHLTPDEISDLLLVVGSEGGEESERAAASRVMWERLAEAIDLPEPVRRASPDEASRRLPGWTPGAWIRMGDGGWWSFKSLKLSEIREDHFDTLDAIRDAEEFDDIAEHIAGLAADNLRSSYGLDDEALAGLMPVVRDMLSGDLDPDNVSLWMALFDVARGQPEGRRRTRHRWLELASVMATGDGEADLSIEDATDLADMLVSAGRLVPSVAWVDSEREAAERMRNAETIDHMI